MNNEAFGRSIDELHERLKQLTATKGAEYTRGADNRFENFERQAQSLGLTREQVLFVFLTKHLDSITTYVKDRAAGRERAYAEPMTGRVDDAILYLLLLRGMVQQNEVKAILDEMPRVTYQEPCPIDFSADARYTPGGAGEPGLKDGEAAFRATPPRTMEVGGVTTPRRTIEVSGPLRTFIISSHQPDSLAMAALMGLPAATSALSTVDQLHGVTPGAHVIFIHHGSRIDEAMYAEVIARCDKQGLTYERQDK